MAQPTRKVEFVNGKVLETPTGGAASTVLDAIGDTLTNAAETSGPLRLNLAASATDVVLSLGNITTANLVVLSTDGAVDVKLNGSSTAQPVNKLLVLFGTVSGILATNPSSSEARAVTLYAATNTD